MTMIQLIISHLSITIWAVWRILAMRYATVPFADEHKSHHPDFRAYAKAAFDIDGWSFAGGLVCALISVLGRTWCYVLTIFRRRCMRGARYTGASRYLCELGPL